ncbi:acyl carrier protein [Streptomyces sp. NPDC053079]|uniref:acyl carrier protein n=2 Tax=unclassified Streptomyces TaxID=2593676 RepID=UPI0037D70071
MRRGEHTVRTADGIPSISQGRVRPADDDLCERGGSMNRTFDIEDLKRILREGAGGVSMLEGDVSDVSFEELGYDSLALLETASRIGREYGLKFEDTAFVDIETPDDLVQVVNAHLLDHSLHN